MSAPDPIPSPSEQSETLSLLAASRDRLLSFCAALAPADWHRSDGADRWTIAQILEHLVTVERRSTSLIERILAQPPEANWHELTAANDAVLAAAAIPSTKVQTPELLHPLGNAEPAQLLHDWEQARASTLALAARPGVAFKEHTFKHLIFGPCNGQQWFRLAAHHTDRHLHQMRACLLAQGRASLSGAPDVAGLGPAPVNGATA